MRILFISIAIIFLLLIFWVLYVGSINEKVILTNVSKHKCKQYGGTFVQETSGTGAGSKIGTTIGTIIAAAGLIPSAGWSAAAAPVGGILGGSVGSLFQKGSCIYYKNK